MILFTARVQKWSTSHLYNSLPFDDTKGTHFPLLWCLVSVVLARFLLLLHDSARLRLQKMHSTRASLDRKMLS